MVNVPVQSMASGGIWWFTDLTIPDPYFILPIMTSLTMLATLELGVDGQRASSLTPQMRMLMRIMPLVMLPVTISFPSAMLCYWTTSNFVSLVQVGVLRIPGMRDRLGIPQYVAHAQAMPQLQQKKSFMEGFNECKTVETYYYVLTLI